MRRGALLVFVAVVGVVSAGAAPSAADRRQPTVDLCERAWNAPGNGAAHRRLHLLGARFAMLRPGVTGTDTWSPVTGKRTTSAESCQLTLVRRGLVHVITGVWANGRVATWRFWTPIPDQGSTLAENVRVRADGRVGPR